MPANERAKRILNLRNQLGKIILKKVRVFKEKKVSIFLSSEKGELYKLRLFFEGDKKNFYLRGISINEAEVEEMNEESFPLSLSEALETIDKRINQLTMEDIFSGVVLIAEKFNPLYLRAWGMASKEFRVPNKVNTKFNIGSINKIFTKIAIAQLTERGLLSLNDKMGKYLPDYPNPEAREKVSIKYLLEMKSGIGDFFGQKFINTPKNFLRHNRDFIGLFSEQSLSFEPGTRQQYSNGSYVVLGEIISKVSGMDYYDYVRKNIYEPAGMNSTDSYEADIPVFNMAEGYTRRTDSAIREGDGSEGKIWRKNTYTRPARGSAAGGGYSTAEDLLRFSKALLEEKLLSPTYTDWVLGGREPSEEIREKIERKSRRRGRFGIAGGAPGINATLEMDLDKGYVVIVLSNYDPPSAERVSKLILRYLEEI